MLNGPRATESFEDAIRGGCFIWQNCKLRVKSDFGESMAGAFLKPKQDHQHRLKKEEQKIGICVIMGGIACSVSKYDRESKQGREIYAQTESSSRIIVKRELRAGSYTTTTTC